MRSSSSNCTPPSLSPNPSCILSSLLLSTSELFSLALCLSRLDWQTLTYQSWILIGGLHIQKSSSSFCFLKIASSVDFLYRFFELFYSWRRVRLSELSAAFAFCWALLPESDYVVSNRYTMYILIKEFLLRKPAGLRSYLIRYRSNTSN